MSEKQRLGRRTRQLVVAIGAHSCVLGLLLLCAPTTMLRAFGFGEPVSTFFPSQCGVFLLILGVCYLYALSEPVFVRVILLSKAIAVAFLLTHAALLDAPPITWAAAAGDAAMLAALTTALLLKR